MRSLAGRAWLAVVAVVAAGCTAGGPSEEVLVSGAASLTEVLTASAQAFEARHPDVDVVLNLAGSATLREQVLAGAPVDVLAVASDEVMADVIDAGLLAAPPVTLARNELRIVVPAGNPGGVTSLADFADDDLLLGLCAAQVPCGDYARRALDRAGVTPAPDTNEPDVRALLTKVAAGELDAGIVYATDVAVGGADVEAVPVPGDVTPNYPVGVLADAPNPEGARAFVDFVTGEAGRAIVVQQGFVAP